MFALFYEQTGRRQFIADVEAGVTAKSMGKLLSRKSGLPVVAIMNLPSGVTADWHRFENGDLVNMPPAQKGAASN